MTDNFSTNPAGIGIRRNLMGGQWAVSFNFDQGSFTKPAGNFVAWTTPNQYNRFWNLNVHKNFTAPNGAMFSLYGGWQSTSLEWPSWPTAAAYTRQSGLRVGADTRVPFAGNWFFVGDVGYGFGGNLTTNAYGTFPAAGTGSGNVLDWHAGLGHNFNPTWAVEGGYRGIQWTITPGPSTCPGSPCNLKWNGWYFGLNFTSP